MESTVDAALEYVMFATRHVPKGDISSAVLLLLIELGLQPHSDGFGYLRESITLKANDNKMRLSAIYQQVVDNYDSTIGYNQIDQAIRSVIKNAWLNGDVEKWQYFFPEIGFEICKRPSNAKFIARFASIMELWIKICKEVSYETK